LETSVFGGPPESAQLYGKPLGALLYVGALGMSPAGGEPIGAATGLPLYGGFYGSARGYAGLVTTEPRRDSAFGIYPDLGALMGALPFLPSYTTLGGGLPLLSGYAGLGGLPLLSGYTDFGGVLLPYTGF
jgi:hypothetical protein